MTSASWIREYKQMDEQQRIATIKKFGRDKNLALVILACAFVFLLVSFLQEFYSDPKSYHLDPESVWHLDTQSMFIMSVSAGICAALGAVMWLRMEMHIRVFDLLGEIKK